ncbi:MAG: hypothetical protein KIT19_09445 [Phycisphaeraceae bacterium]|nr:hypothetical protein [Phycisphaeraceae bacterium]
MLRTRSTVPVWAAAVLFTTSTFGMTVIHGDVAASTEGTGATFSGTLNYVHLGGSVGELTVTLSNDTPAHIGGLLTAFVFRFDTVDMSATTMLTSSTVPSMTNTGTTSGSPFGTYMGGAGVGGTYLGGGMPSGGLAVGASGTFVWTITASDAAMLTDSSFVNASHNPGLLARFRGLEDGGSDKVPGVPTPGSLALIGLGLLAAGRRR